jgi:hypothetical protein
MQLADDETLQAILNGRVPRRRPTVLPPHQPHGQSPRCKCGACVRCLDEIRWERIFKEKFADPEYYDSRPSWGGCSLSWLK